MTHHQIEPMGVVDLERLVRFWQAAHPNHAMEPWMLRERLMAPPNADPGLNFVANDPAGEWVGVAFGAWPLADPGRGGLRWLGVMPGLEGGDLPGQLADAVCGVLASRGATVAAMMATPPLYIRPGVDVRETALIASLLRTGWEQERVNHNMTVDLAVWTVPVQLQPGGGYHIRRAVAGDREEFARWCLDIWGPGWQAESLQAFAHDPISLHFAIDPVGRIAGFAAYHVSQAAGGFGPTGVAGEHRGAGLGKLLLDACLVDLKDMGLERCEIGWVGPVAFYHRAAGATLGPVYWQLSRKLGQNNI